MVGKESDKHIDNLFEQTKDLEFPGAIPGNAPEILYRIEYYIFQAEEHMIRHREIRDILEHVPSVFSYKWKCPLGFDEQARDLAIPPGLIIQRVIEFAVDCRERYKKT